MLCCQFRDNRTSKENFLSTILLYAEVCNVPDDLNEWIPVERVLKDFKDYQCIFYKSVHHPSHHKKPLRDGLHILFPLNTGDRSVEISYHAVDSENDSNLKINQRDFISTIWISSGRLPK